MSRLHISAIFLSGLFIITLFVFLFYIFKEKEHQEEIQKTLYLEHKYKKEKKELNRIRQQTEPCDIPNLDSPKSCYFDSQFNCIWNQEGQRCDKK